MTWAGQKDVIDEMNLRQCLKEEEWCTKGRGARVIRVVTHGCRQKEGVLWRESKNNKTN